MYEWQYCVHTPFSILPLSSSVADDVKHSLAELRDVVMDTGVETKSLSK